MRVATSKSRRFPVSSICHSKVRLGRSPKQEDSAQRPEGAKYRQDCHAATDPFRHIKVETRLSWDVSYESRGMRSGSEDGSTAAREEKA